MTVYATSSDYETYTGASAPANVAALLRSASLLVGEAIRAAVYDVDTNGDATDADVITALTDATCAQAAAWAQLNIDPAAGGVVTAGAATSKSLDGASISYSGTSEAAKARAAVSDQLVPDARRILRAAGLSGTRVWTYG